MQHDLPPLDTATPSLALDKERYRDHLETDRLSQEQQDALLEVLWDIMRSFVELGFDVNAIHNIIPALREFSIDNDIEPLSSEPAAVFTAFMNAAGKESAHVEHTSL